LISWWNHSRPSEDNFLKSIASISQAYPRVSVEVVRTGGVASTHRPIVFFAATFCSAFRCGTTEDTLRQGEPQQVHGHRQYRLYWNFELVGGLLHRYGGGSVRPARPRVRQERQPVDLEERPSSGLREGLVLQLFATTQSVNVFFENIFRRIHPVHLSQIFSQNYFKRQKIWNRSVLRFSYCHLDELSSDVTSKNRSLLRFRIFSPQL
jgi:hypothetical protein